MRLALAIAALVACGESSEPKAVSAPPADAALPRATTAEAPEIDAAPEIDREVASVASCIADSDCRFGYCVDHGCTSFRPTGAKCESDDECEWGCIDAACAGEARARSRRLGVAPRPPKPAVVERPKSAPNSPRTRVVRSPARVALEANAACGSGERLIGGGCQTSAAVAASYPSDFGRWDALGARWNCRATETTRIVAYALCAPAR